MRKIVLFLVVFTAGLVLLLWVDRSTAPEERAPEPPTAEPFPPEMPQATEFKDPEGQVTRVETSGVFEHVERDPLSLQPRYRVRAQEHRSVGEGVFEFEGLEASFFDEEGRRERLVEARLARARLQVEPQVRFDEDHPITMHDVVVTQLDQPQLGQLRLEVPVLEARLGDGTLASDSQVRLEGRGIAASGRGLLLDEAGTSLTLRSDPRAAVELPDGPQVRLRADGPLVLRSRPDLGADVVSMSAGPGALLDLTGEDGLQLWADSVTLIASAPQGLDTVVPLRIDAEGAVRLRPAEGLFSGERGRLEFGPDGRPAGALLEGSPEVDLLLRDAGGESTPLELPAEGRGLRVSATGAGPLRVELGAEERFDFAGPVEVDLAELQVSLSAREQLTGTRDPDGGFLQLTARGNVVAVHPTATLRTERLELASVRLEGGEDALTMRAEDRTLIEGRLEDGRAFALRARDHLVATREGDDPLRVPEARGVELTVHGENGFIARAEEVRDFDLAAGSLTAQGGVTWRDVRATARGERLVVRGQDDVVLEGAPGRRARLELPEGWLEAERLEARGSDYAATGDVELHATVEGTEVDLAARWLTLQRGALAGQAGEPVDWTLDAGGDVRFLAQGPEQELELDSKLLRLQARSATGELRDLEPVRLEASGDVRAAARGEQRFEGRGERLVVDADRNGRLEPAEGRRVELEGVLPRSGLRFVLRSAAVEFGPERIVALNPVIEIDGLDLPLQGAVPGADDPLRVRAVAGRMTVEPESLLLSEQVYVGRLFADRTAWTLDAEKLLVRLMPATGDAAAGQPPEAADARVRDLLAWGGFTARIGDNVQLRGERLEASQETGLLTATGEPAQVLLPDAVWESRWIELNQGTGSIRAATGVLRTVQQGADEGEGFTLRYDSIETESGPDETIQVLREPVLTSGDRELRAAWALFWVDARRWGRLTSGLIGDEEVGQPELPGAGPTPPRRRHPQSLFGFFDTDDVGDWLREVYLEGNIEVIEEGDRLARADAFYLDLVDGHGWVREADISMRLPYTSRERIVKLRAEWLRASADGSYRAEGVVATSCEFEVPHYVLRIGELELEPRTKPRRRRPNEPVQPGKDPDVVEEPDGWFVSARESRLVLWRDLALPLPRIGFPMTDSYQVDREQVSFFGVRPLSFGSDSKFGTFVRASVRTELGWFAVNLHKLLGGSPDLIDLQGDTNFSASWLRDRGLLLGVQTELYSDKYWLDTRIDGLFDEGEDKGLVRVPEDEREDLRGWIRSRGRYLLDEGEWIDLVLTYQGDAGVQAEFFEDEFIEFEERETYLHWRKTDHADYFAATAETRLDDFRSDLVEQPSALHARGSSRVATIAGKPVLYSSRSEVGRFLRREGDPQFPSPFDTALGLPQPGPGDREVLRIDTDHRLELPLSVGVAGARVVPFVSGRATAWDEGLDEDDSPTRAGAFAGVEVSTTLFKQFENGARHEWSPVVAYRGDLGVLDEGGQPVPLDLTEQPLEGRFLDLGLRSRWSHPELRSFLDIELRETHAADTGDGRPDGWQPLYSRASWLSSVAGMPFGISHDARYDLEELETPYSRTFAGFEPIPPLELEFGYHSARDLAGDRLYNAWSLGARYTFSPKWELEGSETVSTSGDGRLSSELVVRRLGHDFIFEIELSFTAGEGSGNSVSFNFEPLITWKRPGLGLLDRWRSQEN